MTMATELRIVKNDPEVQDEQPRDKLPRGVLMFERARKDLGRLMQTMVDAYAIVYKLTAPETEVLNLLLDGHEYVEIAKRSNKSIGTIKNLGTSVFEKFGVRRREELFGLIYGRK